MEASNKLSRSIENESFWQKHHDLLKLSGLSRIKYCQENNLNYDRFGYWISKRNRTQNNKLISVKLKTESVSRPVEEKILCTLNLKSGRCLKIHDTNTLTFILERDC